MSESPKAATNRQPRLRLAVSGLAVEAGATVTARIQLVIGGQPVQLDVTVPKGMCRLQELAAGVSRFGQSRGPDWRTERRRKLGAWFPAAKVVGPVAASLCPLRYLRRAPFRSWLGKCLSRAGRRFRRGLPRRAPDWREWVCEKRSCALMRASPSGDRNLA